MPVQILSGELGTAVVDGNDRRYRYHLTRDFGEGVGSVAFIMLNPSRANHHCDDDTVERCIGFAQTWEGQILEVGNLYAWYATDPDNLRNVEDPIGPHNDWYLRCIATRCSKVVAAWGAQIVRVGALSNQEFRDRANHVLRLLWEAMESAGRTPIIYRLGDLTQAGHPRHPLYTRHDIELVRWGNNHCAPQVE